MFQSLVITLREGVEAALIIGIILGYLKKTGRETWNRVVYWGLAAATGASLAAAYLVRRLEVSEDAYEGWMMLAGAMFVATMVVWMWRTGKRLKGQIEHRLSTLPGSPHPDHHRGHEHCACEHHPAFVSAMFVATMVVWMW